MGAITTLLITLLISLTVTRIASVALEQTGLSSQSARFQARSAFTGCGFTTSESESLVNHPVRRRILAILMLLGNVGLVAVAASVIVAFTEGDGPMGQRGWLLLGGGLLAVAVIANSRLVDRVMCGVIRWALGRFTDLEVSDYSNLLHIADEYRVVETDVERAGLPTGRLRDLDLRGLLVLGVQRPGGEYIGAPHGDTEIQKGDGLLLYGKAASLDQVCGAG